MLSAVYVQAPEESTVKVPYPLEPAVLACATKESSPSSVSEMEREPEVEMLSSTTESSSVTEPEDVPEMVAPSLEPLMVTVTSCVAEPSAEVTVKVSVSVSVEPSS